MHLDESPDLEVERAEQSATPPRITPQAIVNNQANVKHDIPLSEVGAVPFVTGESALHQIQHRLFQLATQIDHIQSQLETLVSETQTSGSQVSALTEHLTDVRTIDTVNERLADLVVTLSEQQEQVSALTQSLQNIVRPDQISALTQSIQGVARQDQIDTLTQMLRQMARSEQIEQLIQSMVDRTQVEQLLQAMADRQQVASLDDALKKLTRTQFKSNTLGENKEQQFEAALNTLREVVNRRQQSEDRQNVRSAQQIAEARNESRAEFAAELLPALDSLELALENGERLLERQQAQMDDVVTQQDTFVNRLATYLTTAQPSPTPGFWQRWRQRDPAIEAIPVPEPLAPERLKTVFTDGTDSMSAWLRGLELVRERFQGLLASEGIQIIDALHQPFDPRLHVAVDTDVRDDVAPDTVVHVVRKGYQQRRRVLRYAEVVVARSVSQ